VVITKYDHALGKISGVVCYEAGHPMPDECQELGYEPILLTDRMDCEAREAGRFLAGILRTHAEDGKKLAFLAGGETVVHLTGLGLRGRNQELVLAAAPGLAGLNNVAPGSFGPPCDITNSEEIGHKAIHFPFLITSILVENGLKNLPYEGSIQ